MKINIAVEISFEELEFLKELEIDHNGSFEFDPASVDLSVVKIFNLLVDKGLIIEHSMNIKTIKYYQHLSVIGKQIKNNLK